MKEFLIQYISEKGQIDFSDFMGIALYQDRFGYYQQSSCPIGREGDFTTAPQMTPVFAYALATQWRQLKPMLDEQTVLEIGPGTGQLALDFLLACKQQGCVPEQYVFLERNPFSQALQKKRLQQYLPEALFKKCLWRDTPMENSWQGLLIANEVLDAQPVHVFIQGQEQLLERFVTLDSGNQFVYQDLPMTNQALLDAVQALGLPNDVGYCSEMNLGLKAWFAGVVGALEKGGVLFVDYGYSQREYYHWQRRQGTLMAYKDHQLVSDLLAMPGEQDLTAHVDFSRVKSIANDFGFDCRGYISQAWFLLESNALDSLSGIDEHKRLASVASLKQLLLPQGMGDIFKVMALTKGELGQWGCWVNHNKVGQLDLPVLMQG